MCEEKTSVLRATRINFSLRLGPLASRSLSSVSGNPRAAGAEGEQVSLGRAGLLGWRGPAEPVRLTRLRSRGKAEARPAWLRFPSPGAAASRPARRPSRAAAFPALSARTSRRGPHVWARPARLRAAPPPAPVPAPAARGRAEALGEGMGGADRVSGSLGPGRLQARFPGRLFPLWAPQGAGGCVSLTLGSSVLGPACFSERSVWRVRFVPQCAACGDRALGAWGAGRPPRGLGGGQLDDSRGSGKEGGRGGRALPGEAARGFSATTWEAQVSKGGRRLKGGLFPQWSQTRRGLPPHSCSNLWNSLRVPQSLFYAKNGLRRVCFYN